MQIEEEVHSSQRLKIFGDTPDRFAEIIQSLLFFRVAMNVHSVEVLSKQIVSKHALEHSLWIQHGNQYEMIVFTQQIRAIILFV